MGKRAKALKQKERKAKAAARAKKKKKKKVTKRKIGIRVGKGKKGAGMGWLRPIMKRAFLKRDFIGAMIQFFGSPKASTFIRRNIVQKLAQLSVKRWRQAGRKAKPAVRGVLACNMNRYLTPFI